MWKRSHLIVIAVVLLVAGCAGTGHRLSGLENEIDRARLDAASLDAQRWCAGEWNAAESLMQKAQEFLDAGQDEMAASAMQQALLLYRSAAECAARRRQQNRMPFPQRIR